jgi:dihydrofolate synthase/folylpolyglutamate synthase
MASSIAYPQCLKAMFGLRRFGIRLGLETIGGMLERLGNPQQAFRAVHVAGTNGKGSVAAGIASILRCAGCRVGLYTSPHLVKFNERICIDGQPISDAAVVDSYQATAKAFQGDRDPTFFELTTAMAFHQFAREQVDWAVIETGMGGRLDATNIIMPALSIITNVSLEHMGYLGNTVAKIAVEKAGIIKPNTPVVTAVRQKSAAAVVEARARQMGAPLYRLGKEFALIRGRKAVFTYRGMANLWPDLRTALFGRHQVDNAALSTAAAEVLLLKGLAPIDEGAVRNGLGHTQWPGRIEIVRQAPLVILDGAHNLVSARTLAAYLSSTYRGRVITLVIGILDDKPYREMLTSLAKVCNRVVVTRPSIGRALPPEQLLTVVQSLGRPCTLIGTVGQAVSHAIENASADEVVVIAGSLYVVGEAKAFLTGQQTYTI